MDYRTGVRGGVAAAVLAVLSACSRGAPPGPPNFFPLHPDDTWIYQVERPLRNQRTRMTVRVRGDRYVGALRQHVQLVDESYANPGEVALGLPADTPAAPEVYPVAYYRKDGFLYRSLSLEYEGGEVRDAGIGTGEERFLPDGLAGDARWDSVTTAYELGGGNGYTIRQMHRAALDAHTIEVPAGRFSGCVRVDTVALHGGRRNGQYEGDPVVLYYADWYAPGVGLIRTVETDRPDNNAAPLARIDLLAYDVAGARRHP